MQESVLLLADNNREFLDTRKETLEEKGYRVVAATNPEEAKQVLQNQHIDLAIIDLKLTDDSPEDVSGLELAKDVASSVPKIMLTAFPELRYVRDALRSGSQGNGAAIDFISKDEGPQKLLAAIERALLRKVFIAHGRDDGALQTIARFLEHLGLQPIIAQEQLKLGRTLVEVLEDHAKVSFAVVLMTPDDTGRLQEEPGSEQPRSRQNVIFELGFFVNKLGRRKVSILQKGDVEIPSGYDVLRLPMDKGGAWKFALAREMKSAGLNVDLNRVA